MIVYHGSNSNFKTLKISPSLCKYESTKQNEGYGIYFSTDREVAESYGKYVYVLDINDDCFIDYRKRPNCQDYVFKIRKAICQQTGIDIQDYINISDTIDRMYWGGLAITGVGREISLCLDNNEKWYTSTTQTKRDLVDRILRQFDKSHKAFMFNYNIKNIGVIKNVDENIVKIIRKEPTYLSKVDFTPTEVSERFEQLTQSPDEHIKKFLDPKRACSEADIDIDIQTPRLTM